jgi:hypothetical protein
MEDSDAFALTTSSMIMEVMVVTRAIAWLETQTFDHVCFLSDAMSILRSRLGTFDGSGWRLLRDQV